MIPGIINYDLEKYELLVEFHHLFSDLFRILFLSLFMVIKIFRKTVRKNWTSILQRSKFFTKNSCSQKNLDKLTKTLVLESAAAALLLREDSIKIMLLPVSCFGKGSIVLRKISGGILFKIRNPFSIVLNWIRVIYLYDPRNYWYPN